MPSFRLVFKDKQADGRYRKVYEKMPKTPFQRLIQSPDVSMERKEEPRRLRTLQNPVGLNRCLNNALDYLLKINREKYNVGTTSALQDHKALTA